jgi:hypothetical protein
MLIYNIATLLIWINITVLLGRLITTCNYRSGVATVPYARKSNYTDRNRIAFQYAKWGFIFTVTV